MADEKIYMLNAIWFKKDGGREKYAEYMKAAAGPVRAVGGEALGAYQTEEALQGDFDPDLIFFVTYPSADALPKMFNSPEYQAIAHLRTEAIEKAVLTRCSPVG